MLRTSLNDFHRQHGARLVDFAGWEMPLLYRGVLDEHRYTRTCCSLFDVSHMGRIDVRGPGAEDFLQKLCTRNVGGMKPGLSRYSHLCNDAGGILDDIIVSRFEQHFLVVCNAANTAKVLSWFGRHADEFDVQLKNRTAESAMLAVQGPRTMEILRQISPVPLDDLKRYHFKSGIVLGVEAAVFRSGYTGEDGVEIVLPAAFAPTVAATLVERSAELGAAILPAGLAARDTLRLEAAMPLYGHELTEDVDSISAGQGWAVDLTKPFIGQPVLKRVADQGPVRKLVGLELNGKRIARQGAAAFHDGREVGVVTSGTHSPTFDVVIAMGFLEAPLANPGTQVEIDLRGARTAARVVPLPFYKRAK